uniref:RING-type E3 ubiquitin transferase n=1 Tax=Cajanus cajan TaxID=3821 RepID=A0A151TYK4_CAJCA|nr:RING-H2 finger protein ATL1E [Cajanus cajan]
MNHTTEHPPGFELSCNEKDETMLELPSVPIKLFVRNIDYESQRIEIYEPQNCLSAQLLKLGNASISPFQFPKPYYGSDGTNVSSFNCDSMSCPILLSESSLDSVQPELVSCTKVKDVLSAKWYNSYSYNDGSVAMEWLKPDCRYCEARGQKCKRKNGTSGETECSVCLTNTTHGLTNVLLIAAGLQSPML